MEKSGHEGFLEEEGLGNTVRIMTCVSLGNHSTSTFNLQIPGLDSVLTKGLILTHRDCECCGVPCPRQKRGMRQTLCAESSLLRAIILQPFQTSPPSALSQLDYCPAILDSTSPPTLRDPHCHHFTLSHFFPSASSWPWPLVPSDTCCGNRIERHTYSHVIFDHFSCSLCRWSFGGKFHE